jgi:hypothetical protein
LCNALFLHRIDFCIAVKTHSQQKHIDMKTRILSVLAAVLLLIIPLINFAQAPPLGTAADFVLFTTVGAISNVGTTDRAKFLTHVTGNVGFQTGSITGFGNVNGVIHSGDGASNACAVDLLIAYNFLAAAIPDSTIANPVIGNDSIIKAGTYQLPNSACSLDLGLTLDAEGDPNAVFIFKMPIGPPNYAFSTSANSKIHLINGAQACNVYWFITGQVNLATGTTMRGTIISGGAINMSASDTLEGRALTINGAITLNNGDVGLLAYKPNGCSSPTLTGPTAPEFIDAKCFTIFSSNKSVADDNFSQITGYVGGNTVAPSNYDPILVPDGIYATNGTTADAATNLGDVYAYLNGLSEDIILTAPTLFGNELVLTPHTYLLNAAVTLTDTLYLDALGNADAVFIIKTQGAFATTSNSNVKLINGTKAENVYWMVNGAVSLAANSIFNGTIVVTDALSLLSGVQINGRALSIDGAVDTHSIIATLTPGCITNSAPMITSEPADQIACEGDSISFTIEATGTDLTYKWRRGTEDLIDGLTISGATTDTLTINPINITDAAANYNVVVSGLLAPNDTSATASLTVNVAPVIVTEPTNQAICGIGDQVSFVVEATGTNLTYQWRKGAVNIVNGGTISGANNDTLIINPVDITDAADNYNVIVSGTCSPNDTSINVSLQLDSAPIITVEPESQAVCEGESAIFTVEALGTELSYQWRNGDLPITENAIYSGTTTNTLTVDPQYFSMAEVPNNFNVIVSGLCSPGDTSVYVTIMLNQELTIVEHPSHQNTCQGGTVMFSIIADGSAITYQWRKGTTDLVDGDRISGSTSALLTIEDIVAADNGEDYNVVLSGACFPDSISAFVSLNVGTIPTISIEATNLRVCAGGSAVFSVTTTGSYYGYRWRRGTVDLIEGGNISGANTPTLTIFPVNADDADNDYNVLIYGSCFFNVISANHSLVVDTEPVIVIQPVDQVVCSGSSATFSVKATGTDLNYQWRRGSTDLSDGVNISGANSAILTIDQVNGSDISNSYNVVIKGLCSPAVISANASLHIDNTPNINNQPADRVVCEGNSASFSVVTSGSGNTYQWRRGDEYLLNGPTISGANSATLTINPVNSSDAASDYNVVISGACMYFEISDNASLTVETAPEITNEPVDQSVCAGGSATFSMTAKGTGLTYQWRRGTVNVSNGSTISGARTNELTISPVSVTDAANNYNVVVSGTCLSSKTSLEVSLQVNNSTEITAEPTHQVACVGNEVHFSVTASGVDLSYQWRRGSVNLTNGGNISGANSPMLTINPVMILNAATNYNVVIGSSCMADKTSINAILSLDSSVEIKSEPANQTACVGSIATFSIAATGTGLTYQWRKGTVNLTDGGNLSGTNSADLTINPVNSTDAATNYNVVVGGDCGTNKTSFDASLSVNTMPAITLEPSDQNVCSGSSANFLVAATGSGLSFQWRNGTVNLSNGGRFSGVTSTALTINQVNSSDASSNYNVVVSGACYPGMTSSDAVLVVNTAPSITAYPIDQTACENGCPVSFSVAATGSGLTYQWRKGTIDLSNGGNISGANTNVLTINPVSTSDVYSHYNVVVSGVCSPVRTTADASLFGWVSSAELTVNSANRVLVYPNPFTTSLNIMINNFAEIDNCELIVFNIIGDEVVNTTITKQLTTLVTSNLRTGFYFYKIIGNDKIIQSGKLILR